MSRIATMGTSSCATIALAGFKQGQKELNEAFKAGLWEGNKQDAFDSVKNFWSKTLYPTSQPLGATDEFPFTLLMKALDESRMVDKFIIATLNEHQQQGLGGYWAKELTAHGFKLVDKTKNNIGSMCYIYIRNNARPEGHIVKEY
jgi:hypothetical protein